MIRPGRYGFRARIRALIKSEPLPWEAKAELFWMLSRLGPYDAWEKYKLLTNQQVKEVQNEISTSNT